MNSRDNVRLVLRLLVIGCLFASVGGVVAEAKSTKGVLIGLAVAFLLGGIITLIIYRWKPGAFKDRPDKPD